MAAHVSMSPFEGVCGVCGSNAGCFETPGTALLKSRSTGQLSTVSVSVVSCYEDSEHEYYVLERSTEVLDPFAPGAPATESERS